MSKVTKLVEPVNRHHSISRSNALQQMAAISLGTCLLPMISCRTEAKEAKNDTMLKELNTFYLPAPEKPLEIGPMGLNVRTLIRSAQTGGHYSTVEVAIRKKQMGPAPHIHKKLDELMLVTKGTITWMVGDEVFHVKKGGWMFRPHGIMHTFWNDTDEPALAVDMFFGQNLEDYLEILFHQIFPEMIKKGLTPASLEIHHKMEALGKKFGVTIFPEKRQAIIDKYGLHP